jgi:hypothetical protein
MIIHRKKFETNYETQSQLIQCWKIKMKLQNYKKFDSIQPELTH